MVCIVLAHFYHEIPSSVRKIEQFIVLLPKLHILDISVNRT